MKELPFRLQGDKTKPPIPVFLLDDGSVKFTADADIDADGSPRAYNPNNYIGLDDIQNAKNGSQWVGVVTHGGVPFIQGENDPAPGFYVSPTTLQNKAFPIQDPRRYVDASKVPFIVVSPLIIKAVGPIVMGCFASVKYNGRSVDCVVADQGPTRKAGELSIEAARLLGIPHSARTGGEERNIVEYHIFPGKKAVINGIEYPLQPS